MYINANILPYYLRALYFFGAKQYILSNHILQAVFIYLQYTFHAIQAFHKKNCIITISLSPYYVCDRSSLNVSEMRLLY